MRRDPPARPVRGVGPRPHGHARARPIRGRAAGRRRGPVRPGRRGGSGGRGGGRRLARGRPDSLTCCRKPVVAFTGAELLVRGLEAAGVEVSFGLPGVHNLAAWKALSSSDIRLVGVRHEQTAVYAADGYARASGRVGVAITTTGPGAANTLGALGEAWASGSPVVVIATDIPSSIRRPGVYRGALHEASDQEAMFKPVTKATFKVADPGTAGHAIQRAIQTAISAPSRPVYVEVPTDVLSAEAPADL